ncbi:MAG: hypothetical protein A2W35_20105 [Chloroflexi bacterium RBG_16_57_11]|nr:MAG: hypothetical protein A2W35_20105 [Chloroflexi bacterium RBG_16_57_11]
MTLPALLFGFILSSAYGAAFHLWRGGGPGRLLLDLFLAWSGFALGQILGDSLEVSFGRLGSLHIGLATILSLAFLFVGYWLSKAPEKK